MDIPFEEILDGWVISDTHFRHKNIIQYCNRPLDCDRLMIDRWRDLVDDTDTILHLGDLALLKKDRVESMAELIGGLPGRKLMVRGNHDRMSARTYEQLGFRLLPSFTMKVCRSPKGFICLADTVRGVSPDDVWEVSFDHYPVEGSRIGERELRVHGHIHNNGYGRVGAARMPYKRGQLNVSVEMTGFEPVQVRELLNGVIP